MTVAPKGVIKVVHALAVRVCVEHRCDWGLGACGMLTRLDHLIPAHTRIGAGFLEPYLPPLAENVVAACIEALTSTGDLVLDPFCQSPAVVLAAASLGRRVIASSANPIDAFAVRQTLAPPSERDLNAAATALGETLRGTALLRDHILRLYRCACPSCRRQTFADYFIWDMERGAPIEKYVRCPACGFQGSALVQADDMAVLEQIEGKGLTYFFVLDRLSPAGDPARQEGEALLKFYTTRARYALTQMVIKTEAEFANTLAEKTLKYLLLGCLVRCGLFNRPPVGKHMPAARASGLGLERNVWLAFEEAWVEWRDRPRPPPVAGLSATFGPESLAEVLAGRTSAAVLHCSIRDLARMLPVQSVRLLVTGLANIGQRYWRLCFLWAGWLFGKESAAYLKPLLRQPIPDWAWYVRTIAAAFQALRPKLHLHGHLAMLLSPRRSAQAEAALMAGALAGFRPVAHVYAPRSVAEAAQGGGDYQIILAKGAEVLEGVTRPPDLGFLRSELRDEAERGAREALAQRGEPLPTGWLRHGAFARLAQRGLLQRALLPRDEGYSGYEVIHKAVEEALGKDAREPLVPMEWEAHLAPDATIPMLWLPKPSDVTAPLGDRVEAAVVEILRGTLMLRREDCEDAVYRRFPGLQTPEEDWVSACLESYAQEASPGWIRLRDDDQSERVRLAVAEFIAELETLGRRMGLQVAVDKPPYHVVWAADGALHAFLFSPTTVVHTLVGLGPPAQDTARYVVIPESRLALLRLKLRRSPIYGRILQQGGWALIRQPLLQGLLKLPVVDIHSLKRVVGLDPIIEKGEAQIPLF